MNRLAYIISTVSIIVAIFLMLVFGYWYFAPYKTIEFNTPEHKVLTPVVAHGEELVYEVDFCKYSEIRPMVFRYFKDGLIYAVPDVMATNNVTGCSKNVVYLTIPKGLPNGEFVLELVFVYQVNPIREIIVYSKTEKFVVE